MSFNLSETPAFWFPLSTPNGAAFISYLLPDTLRQTTVIMRETSHPYLYGLHRKTLPHLAKVTLSLWPWIWMEVCVVYAHTCMKRCSPDVTVAASAISGSFNLLPFSIWLQFSNWELHQLPNATVTPPQLSRPAAGFTAHTQPVARWLCWPCLGSFLLEHRPADLDWPWLGQSRWLCATLSLMVWASLEVVSRQQQKRKSNHGRGLKASAPSHLLNIPLAQTSHVADLTVLVRHVLVT